MESEGSESTQVASPRTEASASTEQESTTSEQDTTTTQADPTSTSTQESESSDAADEDSSASGGQTATSGGSGGAGGAPGADGSEDAADADGAGGAPAAGGAAGAAGGAGGQAEETSNEAPDDPCATALLCDDFEDDTSGSPPGDPWQSDTNGGDVSVSDERAFSGERSVHVSNTAGAYKRAYFSVQGDPVFPGAGQEMYGRMMMWLEATPAGSVHWTFIQAEGPSDDGSYDIYYRYGGQHEGRLMANFETIGVSTDCWDHSDTVMPTQTWSCLEWRFDASTDEMQFWLDGTEIADMHVVGMGEGCGGQDLGGAWPAPSQFEILRLGWEKYQESSEINAWIDDVVLSTSRVGCPEPSQ
jgi:hypothetical protein